jgi:hypothetical protein
MFGEEDDDDMVDDIDLNDDGTPKEVTQTPPAFDPSTLTASISEAIAAGLQQHAPAPPPKQMTQEELAAHFAVWNPDDSFVNGLNAISDPEADVATRRKIVTDMRDGIMQQAFRAAQLVVQEEIARFRGEVAPAVNFAQQRQAKQVMKDFATAYPALDGQDELVNTITAGLQQNGFKPKSKDEAFKKVAEIAEGILKRVNPQFALNKSGGSNGKPSMAKTGMGGTQGGNTQQRANGPVKRGQLASFWPE